ncbi:MAG TPA: hypothetical protein VF821_34235 [Lentzea sp.]
MSTTTSTRLPRVLVLGTGFAGHHRLRALERRLPRDTAELVAVDLSAAEDIGLADTGLPPSAACHTGTT